MKENYKLRRQGRRQAEFCIKSTIFGKLYLSEQGYEIADINLLEKDVSLAANAIFRFEELRQMKKQGKIKENR